MRKRTSRAGGQAGAVVGVLAALGSLGATGCQGVKCTPVTATVTGDLSKDIVGTWSDFGTDSPVVFDFQTGGKVRIVEAPNMYSPGGSASTRNYSVDTAAGTWTLEGTGTAVPFTVTESSFIETPTGSTTPRNHPRVTCTGFGFSG